MEIQLIRNVILHFRLVLFFLLFFFYSVTLANAVGSSVFYVAQGGSCGGISNCYTTIQAAVDAATSNDEIRVAVGTYTDVHSRPRNDTTTTGNVNQVVYLDKTLNIRGGYKDDFTEWNPAAYVTKVDAQHNGRGIYITGSVSPTIEGLSITGGDAAGLQGYSYYGDYDAGGGVYIMNGTATLNGNRIFNNSAQYGGGVFLGNSDSRLTNNNFSNNSVTNGGAGAFLYKGAPVLTGNTISANTSNNLGGGIYIFYSEATLSSNTITGNSANVLGGGVDVASCGPGFSGNLITKNTASRGGGMYLWYSNSLMTNNVIADNKAGSMGSGLYIAGSQLQLLHSTIARNTEGDGNGILVTTAGSTDSTVTMENTILVEQAVGITTDAGSTVNVDGILWFDNGVNTAGAGGVSVSNAFTGDPAFLADGYHLSAGSAAIDKGIDAGVTTDIDGQHRTGIADLGADEFQAPANWNLFLPAIIHNKVSQ